MTLSAATLLHEPIIIHKLPCSCVLGQYIIPFASSQNRNYTGALRAHQGGELRGAV